MQSIIKKNKRAQLDFPLLSFAIIVITLLLLAPIILKITRTSVEPFSNALGNMSIAGSDVASQNTSYVLGVFVSFWDGVIMFSFVISLILLFISAFFIDTSPFFIAIYIVLFLLVMIFAPNILEVVDRIYELNAFAEEVALMPMMDFIRLNFGLILTVVGILTMIIMYAKVRYFPSQS